MTFDKFWNKIIIGVLLVLAVIFALGFIDNAVNPHTPTETESNFEIGYVTAVDGGFITVSVEDMVFYVDNNYFETGDTVRLIIEDNQIVNIERMIG